MKLYSRDRYSAPSKTVFLAVTAIIFLLSLSAAESVGFVPSYIDGTKPLASARPPDARGASTPVSGEAPAPEEAIRSLPERIAIPAIDLDLTVQNPMTTDLKALDEVLKNGPARYAHSAELGERGTVIIFAHSSRLPVVHNRMYKAFNDVPTLEAGDTITLSGEEGKQYLYAVKRIYEADANETIIDVSPASGTRLVLVTCDNFSGGSARYVLEADFVGTV